MWMENWKIPMIFHPQVHSIYQVADYGWVRIRIQSVVDGLPEKPLTDGWTTYDFTIVH